MKLNQLISLATVFIFLVLIIFKSNPRRFYILFVLFLLPVMDLTISPPQWGSLRVFDALSYIGFVITFKDFLSIRKKHKIYHILFCFLTTFLVFGSLFSLFVQNSLISLLTVFPIFIFSKSLINECLADEDFQKKILVCLKAVAIFTILFLIAQIVIGLKFTFYENLNRNTVDPRGLRYPSVFHDPQKYQQFLAMLSFVFLINIPEIKKPTFNNYLFLLIVIGAMTATGGRSAFIGLFAGLALLFIFLGSQYKIILVSICLAAGLIILAFSNSILMLQRSATFSEDYFIRASLWKEAYQIFLDHPFLGIGTGNFHSYATIFSNNYFINTNNDVIFFEQPESGYWLILTELGIPGSILSFLFILKPMYDGIKGYLTGKNTLIIALFVAPVLSWLVSFVSVYSLADKRILILVVVFLCLLITSNKSNPKYDL